MEQFLNMHKDHITGTISVFDRIILKGYLPFCYPGAAENFLFHNGVLLKDFRSFTSKYTEALKNHAQQVADKAKRPFEYHRKKIRKEEYARNMAQRDDITQGLICVIARNEQNYSFGLRYGKGRPNLVKNSPQCLTLYFYFMDRHFGLMHVRLSTWMPFSIQVYINGHEWLARQMDKRGIGYEMFENAFTIIEDCTKAQKLADKLGAIKWEKILHVFARKVNPLLKTILKGMEYYWVIDQAEYATDVMVGTTSWLNELYIKWQKHCAVCFQAQDIMSFMGRKLHGSFNSTIVTNVKKRPSVTRIKHVVRGNWIKMYNKNGIVLRVETVINRPGEFRRYRISRGKKAGSYQPMRKRVTNMAAYAQVSLRANRAYIDALAAVEDTTIETRELAQLCAPVQRNKRRIRALNPFAALEAKLFEAVIQGGNHVHGFKAGEIGKVLGINYSNDPVEKRRQSAGVNRKLWLLRGHGLIARQSRSMRYRITTKGAKLINASIALKINTYPEKIKKAA